MNRTSFITLNKTRLFTAEQVCDIVEEERERVLNDGGDFIEAINRRIVFLTNLKYSGELPLLDNLTSLKRELELCNRVFDEEESLRGGE